MESLLKQAEAHGFNTLRVVAGSRIFKLLVIREWLRHKYKIHISVHPDVEALDPKGRFEASIVKRNKPINCVQSFEHIRTDRDPETGKVFYSFEAGLRSMLMFVFENTERFKIKSTNVQAEETFD